MTRFALPLSLLLIFTCTLSCKPRRTGSHVASTTVTDLRDSGPMQYSIFETKISSEEADRLRKAFEDRGLKTKNVPKEGDTYVYMNGCQPKSPRSGSRREPTSNLPPKDKALIVRNCEDLKQGWVGKSNEHEQNGDEIFLRKREECDLDLGVLPVEKSVFSDAVFSTFHPSDYQMVDKTISNLEDDLKAINSDIAFNQAAFNRLVKDRPRTDSPDDSNLWYAKATTAESSLSGLFQEKVEISSSLERVRYASKVTDTILKGLGCSTDTAVLSGEFYSNGGAKTDPILQAFLTQPRVVATVVQDANSLIIPGGSSFNDQKVVNVNVQGNFSVSAARVRVEFYSRYTKNLLETRITAGSKSVVIPAQSQAYRCDPRTNSTGMSRMYSCVMNLDPNSVVYPQDVRQMFANGIQAQGNWRFEFAQPTNSDPEYPTKISRVTLNLQTDAPLIESPDKSYNILDQVLGPGQSQTIELSWFNPSKLAVDLPLVASFITGGRSQISAVLINPNGDKFNLSELKGASDTRTILSIPQFSKSNFESFIKGSPKTSKGWKLAVSNSGTQPATLAGVQSYAPSSAPNTPPGGGANNGGGTNPSGSPNTTPATPTNDPALIKACPAAIAGKPSQVDPGVGAGMRQINSELRVMSGSDKLSPQERENCLKVTPKDRWSDLMAHYYCGFPGKAVRECFTGKVRALATAGGDPKKNYSDAFDYCATAPGTEFSWVARNQPNVFKYVMFTVGELDSFEAPSQKQVISEYYQKLNLAVPSRD